MPVLVWVMVAIALWHFTVFVPDRFAGGIVGAFMVALVGGLAGGFLLPSPGLPLDSPPAMGETIFAALGAIGALALSYAYGSRAARPHRAPAPAVARCQYEQTATEATTRRVTAHQATTTLGRRRRRGPSSRRCSTLAKLPFACAGQGDSRVAP